MVCTVILVIFMLFYFYMLSLLYIGLYLHALCMVSLVEEVNIWEL